MVVENGHQPYPHLLRAHLLGAKKRGTLLKLAFRLAPKPKPVFNPLQKAVRLPQPPVARVNEPAFRRVGERFNPFRKVPRPNRKKQIQKQP